MKTRSKNQRLGKIIFLAPIVIIVGFVVIGFIEATAPGTLAVQAFAQDKYLSGSSASTLYAPFAIGSASGTTPASLAESPGVYLVTFDSLDWYTTPASTSVSVDSHVTVYATGIYSVIPRFVSVTEASGFNNTSFSVKHGVTPVIWINPSDTNVQFTISGLGQETIQAGQNLTIIFQNPGNFDYSLTAGSSNNNSGAVSVQ